MQKKGHVDSLVINDKEKSLYLIEAKRLNASNKKASITRDLLRMERIFDSSISGVNLSSACDKSYVKYLIILADIWIPHSSKRTTIKTNLKKWFKDALDLPVTSDVDFYCKEVTKNGSHLTKKEEYHLLCKVWKLKAEVNHI